MEIYESGRCILPTNILGLSIKGKGDYKLNNQKNDNREHQSLSTIE